MVHFSLRVAPIGRCVMSSWWWFSRQVVSNSCDPMDCSLPGSSVHGIFQARILEWVAISFSRGSSRPRNRTQVSRITGRFQLISSYTWGNRPRDISTARSSHVAKWQSQDLNPSRAVCTESLDLALVCSQGLVRLRPWVEYQNCLESLVTDSTLCPGWSES